MANTKKYVSLDKLGLYDEKIKGVIAAGDTAALNSAKSYADGLASNYDAAGSAASAETNAKTYADTKVNELANGQVKTNKEAIEGIVADYLKAADKTELQNAINAVDAIADKNAEDIAAINNAETGILKQAKDYADAEVAKVQGEVDNLEAYVGTLPEGATATNVVAYVQEKTSGIATSENLQELTNRVAQAEKDIDAIEADYLVEADKTALQGNIDAVSAVANAAVKQSDYNTKVGELEAEDTRIEGLVIAEAAKAREEEGKLDARLVEVETFFKTAEGETLDQALDTLVELQKYLSDEGAVADQMLLDIAANAKAIEDHGKVDHDFAGADAALKSELEGKINLKADSSVVEGIDGRVEVVEGKVEVVEGKVSTLEGQMTAVQGAVATKVEQEAYNTKIAALEGADAGQVERIAALEAKFGGAEGSVEDQIADAKQEAIDTAAADAKSKADKALEDAKSYTDGEIDKVEGTISNLETVVNGKAAQSDLTALAGRVTTAEGEIDTLQSEMDTVEALAAANKAAHEANAAAIALKASQADLEAVSGRVTTLETWHSNFVECSQEDINNLFN